MVVVEEYDVWEMVVVVNYVGEVDHCFIALVDWNCQGSGW